MQSESGGLTYKLISSYHPPSGLQGFKLFFRLRWEPFEAQFSSIEASFLNRTIVVVRLANVDYQNRALEDQNRVLKLLEDQKRVLGFLEHQKKEGKYSVLL